MSEGPLADKVALVTGGARRVGAQIARKLHAQGMNLVIHYRSSEQEAHRFLFIWIRRCLTLVGWQDQVTRNPLAYQFARLLQLRRELRDMITVTNVRPGLGKFAGKQTLQHHVEKLVQENEL